jgi:hypothetical protein
VAKQGCDSAVSFDYGLVFKNSDAQRWLDGKPGEFALFKAPTDEVLEKYYPHISEKGATKRRPAGSGSDRTSAAEASYTSN